MNKYIVFFVLLFAIPVYAGVTSSFVVTMSPTACGNTLTVTANQDVNCSLCPAGSFQDLAGQTSCLSCQDGDIQPAEGQTACLGAGQCDALFGLKRSGFETGLWPIQ
ncbi:MAG: hypothetical protein ACWA5R_04605 [bacterium]